MIRDKLTAPLEAWRSQASRELETEAKRESGDVNRVVQRSLAALEPLDAPAEAKQAAMTALLLDVARTLSDVERARRAAEAQLTKNAFDGLSSAIDAASEGAVRRGTAAGTASAEAVRQGATLLAEQLVEQLARHVAHERGLGNDPFPGHDSYYGHTTGFAVSLLLGDWRAALEKKGATKPALAELATALEGNAESPLRTELLADLTKAIGDRGLGQVVALGNEDGPGGRILRMLVRAPGADASQDRSIVDPDFFH